jgi:hypothetical protein
MGAAYYITLEREIEGFHSMTDGKALIAASDKLEKVARKLQVTPLGGFVSAGAEELEDLLGEDAADVPDLPPKTWHPAKDGLKTVRALLDHVRRSPKDVKESDRVVADLEDLERILLKAEQENVKWHLSVDF